MNNIYYHVNEKELQPGEVKPPSYGHTVDGGDASDPEAELLREKIRAEQFREKPSRLRSNYVFESLEEAKQFRQSFRHPAHFIYEVKFAKEPTSIHKACCTSHWDHENEAQRIFDARMYWANPPLYDTSLNEVFAEENLVIVRQIDPPANTCFQP